MPEWFRPNSMFHSFHNSPVDNSFVFVIYYTDWTDYTTNEILDSIESFPNKCEIYFYYKDKLNIGNISNKFDFKLTLEEKIEYQKQKKLKAKEKKKEGF